MKKYDKIESEKMDRMLEQLSMKMGKSAHMHENGESFDAYVELYNACKEFRQELIQNKKFHLE